MAEAAPRFAFDRPPDITICLSTAANQALIYRLSGDLNPVHVDPAMAEAAGLARPILHGMCSFGIAGRALLQSLCGNDPAGLKSIRCRFSAPVYPGDTIRTEIWRDTGGTIRFRAVAEGREQAVLTHGSATLN